MIGSAMPPATGPPARGTPVLDVQGLARSFGGVYAVSDVSMSVGEGELRGVIGPNGAGKPNIGKRQIFVPAVPRRVPRSLTSRSPAMMCADVAGQRRAATATHRDDGLISVTWSR